LKLTIIVPAYNEENTIAEAVRRALDAPLVIHGAEIEREVIIVDDASTDATEKIVDAMDDARVKVLHHDVNKGKGASIRTALEQADGDITVVHDADLEYDPNDFAALITPIVRGEAKVVYGTRFYLGYPVGMRFANYAANRLLRDMANLLYWGNITDEATCYKAFRTDLLKSYKLNSVPKSRRRRCGGGSGSARCRSAIRRAARIWGRRSDGAMVSSPHGHC
jgi:dolichol-phosphate mannosyltransferase